MRIEFIGVGEAFEPELGNASYLIHSDTKLLIDCGYGVPRNLFEKKYAPNFIDAIYVTHFHADHTFGIPPLVNRWNEDGRTKPLTFLGQPGVEEHVKQLIDLGYPTCRNKLQYDLNFIETIEPTTLKELQLSFAKTDHGQSNYAIKILCGEIKLGISGDGGLTPETEKLFQDCTHLIHEAFGYAEAKKGHTTALKVVEYAQSMPSLKTLALVHIHRDQRVEFSDQFKKINVTAPFEVILPEPGNMF